MIRNGEFTYTAWDRTEVISGMLCLPGVLALIMRPFISTRPLADLSVACAAQGFKLSRG